MPGVNLEIGNWKYPHKFLDINGLIFFSLFHNNIINYKTHVVRRISQSAKFTGCVIFLIFQIKFYCQVLKVYQI